MHLWKFISEQHMRTMRTSTLSIPYWTTSRIITLVDQEEDELVHNRNFQSDFGMLCHELKWIYPGQTITLKGGWHNRFSSIINGAHPTLWKFLENLKAEEILSRAETAQVLGGHQFPAKKKYADSAKRVKKLVSEYQSRSSNVVSYLRGIAHNLKF